MNEPLWQVLSLILAEYGNCDRLLEVLEQSEEIPDPIPNKTIVFLL